MKANNIALHQQKLLVAFEFIRQYPDKVSNLHRLHDDYLGFCRSKLNVKYAFGKFAFAGIIQKLGVRRCRTMGPSIWKLPEEFDPEELIELIQTETERLILNGEGREANFGNFK
jgi:hypothetical protein